jgi:pyruvate, water dikinase
MNSRQAYHYAVVDAFLSDNQNNNHISIRVKGGGAAAWQRSLRVEFMARILRMHHFTVELAGDVLTAWVRGIDSVSGADEMTTIGHLLRFCAQLDMWMTSHAEADRYVHVFLDAQAALRAEPSGRASAVTAPAVP